MLQKLLLPDADIDTVLNTLEQAQTRTNVMHRALRQVDALPEAQSQQLLPGAQEDVE